ncbi:MAG: UDP-N-acetylmuramoyl-tripeptide--D-alanyl-D-alanine ligase [Halieaceae bacterium]|nr:UDP-N-acetylmuramoyl-tripeptide--D-alanyl-D-alanine ligase [Halieaceae bacterium]
MMSAFKLSDVAAPLSGDVHGADARFLRVATDSRQVREGDLFVALRGERFDAHDFLPQVCEAGAAAAMVSHVVDVALPQIKVDDTERGLGLLGAYNREQYRGPLVAITGSNGKTTVKNLTAAVLSQGGQTLATEGNLNNEIGVPLTLLAIEPGTKYAVVEMGAGKPGDIAWLCELGKPTVSVVLNAMPAHLERMGSVEEVANTKGAIYDRLGADGVAIINNDQPWASQWKVRAGEARVLSFGMHTPADVMARDVQLLGVQGSRFVASTPVGDIKVALTLPGEHNIMNALAAICAGIACGLAPAEIESGLAAAQVTGGRLALEETHSGAQLIDDCYNANPGSVRAAIQVLAQCKGQRVLILGAMRELGDDEAALHRQMGEAARDAGLDGFWGVGDALRDAVAAFGSQGRFFPSMDAAQVAAHGAFASGTTVLVKGSRGAQMERLLPVIRGEMSAGSTSC